MSVLSEELKNSQFQTLRFKRERDSFKQILDSADSNNQKGNYKIQNNGNQVIFRCLFEWFLVFKFDLTFVYLNCNL